MKSPTKFLATLLFCIFPLLLMAGSKGYGDAKIFHAVQKSLTASTAYYFPDGLASQDSAWNHIGSFGNAPTHFTLLAMLDSISGYSSPCSLRIECLYGIDGDSTDGLIKRDTMRVDTMMAISYPATSVVFNTPFYIVPEDTIYNIQCGIALNDKYRWKVTPTKNVSLTLIEKTGKQ